MDNSTQAKKDVYTIATEHVLQHLEHGRVPWLTTWTEAGIPQNLITRKEFRFINVFLLASLGYKKNFFLSPKQVEDIGASVKKGQKGNVIFYWKWKDQNAEENGTGGKEKPLLRYFYAYNVEQCNDIKKGRIPKIEVPKHPLEMCLAIVANMPNSPGISHGVHPAAYLPTMDCIDIPKKEDFPNDESYFVTLFRTLIHSTGHESRLNRKEVMEATVTDFDFLSKESLIADIGASHLCSLAGIRYSLISDVSEYCLRWTQNLKKDPNLIVYVSTQAQKAVDFIMNRKREFSKTEE